MLLLLKFERKQTAKATKVRKQTAKTPRVRKQQEKKELEDIKDVINQLMK